MTDAPFKQAGVVRAVKSAEGRAVSEPPKPVHHRRPSNFRQQDVARAIKAAKSSGLNIARIEIEPDTPKITMVMKDGAMTEETTPANPFADAPVVDPALRRRKTKAP
jgi:hypothetical protein